MSGCIFCDILAGSEPASMVYEDDLAIVILDLFPVSDGHALVIARQHAAKVNQLAPGIAAHMMALASRVMTAQGQLDPSIEAHNLLINDGKVANQHVPHVHFNVIPRRRGDGVQSLLNWSTRFLQRFNMTARRQRLDRLAAALHEQLRAG
jgi:diadenosine tetraphosphate (Ap4A) HIT family hydrolase